MRIASKKVLTEWSKGRKNPGKELEFKADLAPGTVRKLFKGEPVSRKVREVVSLATGIDEEILFPFLSEDEFAA
jgi:hypothetical protein